MFDGSIIIIDYLEKTKIINKTAAHPYWSVWKSKQSKMDQIEERGCAISSRWSTVSQINVDKNNSALIGLRIASTSTIFSKSDPRDFFLFSNAWWGGIKIKCLILRVKMNCHSRKCLNFNFRVEIFNRHSFFEKCDVKSKRLSAKSHRIRKIRQESLIIFSTKNMR